MIIARQFILFIVYSFLGWVWETIYCTIQEKQFQNRGFLFGPVCPIYGVSVTIVQILISVSVRGAGGPLPVWQMFLICAAGSVVIEYGTSWYLEKRFHARWWDYSALPLNINGRICFPVTVCFGLGGVVIGRYILPAILSVEAKMHPLAAEAAALALMGVFAADFALTEASLNALIQHIEDAERTFSEKAEAARQKVAATPAQLETMLKTVQEETNTKIRNAAASLTYRERMIIKKIKRFSPVRGVRYPAMAGEALKKMIRQVRPDTRKKYSRNPEEPADGRQTDAAADMASEQCEKDAV